MRDCHMAFYTAVGTNPLVLGSVWLEKPTGEKPGYNFFFLLSNMPRGKPPASLLWCNIVATSAFATKASEDDTLFRNN